MPRSLFHMALILGLAAAVSPFAIDMYLPALPQVAAELGSDEAGAQATLAAYFLTFGLAQLLFGPMSDAMGRKLPLILGILIFIVATVGAALAPDMGWLIAARAVQGFGAATLMVVPRAVIRDVATGPEGARMMAAIMIVISVSPMLAPLAGSGVMAVAGWRWIFGSLAVAALVSLLLIVSALPETLPPPRRHPIRARPLLDGARRLLLDRDFMGLTLIGGFGMASFFVFLAAASFVYTGHYGLSPTGFSIAFALNAIGFFTASQFAGPAAERWGMQRVVAISVTCFTFMALATTGMVWAGFDALWMVVAGLFLGNAFLGLVLPTTMVMALDPHPEIAGLASSLGGTLQMLTGGAMIALAGPFLGTEPGPMVTAIAICGLLAWLTAFLALPRLRLRRQPRTATP